MERVIPAFSGAGELGTELAAASDGLDCLALAAEVLGGGLTWLTFGYCGLRYRVLSPTLGDTAADPCPVTGAKPRHH